MLIIPAIDLRNGKCVNLLQGRPEEETIFSNQPVTMAQQWQQEGAEYLHLVDLDGAFRGTASNLPIVKQIIGAVSIPTQLGGGIRTIERLHQIMDLGVSRAILGTAALKNPQLVEEALNIYGERIAVGIDAKDGMVATEGWLNLSQVSAFTFAKEIEAKGIQTIIYTDIKSDGMLKGPNLASTQTLIQTVNINVIASGGITSIQDVVDLKTCGATGAIIGRALYTKMLNLKAAITAAH
ncbi:MAG: 1-(5-phosphoribosyl)-5-[(5-phosphoribosylamino)methylideneamino]imidazole-4-carboxamide isomerase [Candidatus Poribacteria bacterium]|nr:1-(5-phosphoribosyl)-5-[(5-phosphoribosylamino)methylideneamino]imidazole-4-carboxamide isomerase [Candidatus Poribacteria bacterium]